MTTLLFLAAACSSAVSDPAATSEDGPRSSARSKDAGATSKSDGAVNGGDADAGHDEDGGASTRDASDAASDAGSAPDVGAPPKDGGGTSPPVDASPPCAARIYYEDLDLDGYGSSVTVTACRAPSGYVALRGDCDDENPLVHPNETVYYETPYTLADGTLSFDYDCNGVEDSPPNPSPLCSATHCVDRHLDPGNTCVRPGSTAERALASPNATCGEPLLQCYPTSSGAPAWMENGNIRRCR